MQIHKHVCGVSKEGFSLPPPAGRRLATLGIFPPRDTEGSWDTRRSTDGVGSAGTLTLPRSSLQYPFARVFWCLSD